LGAGGVLKRIEGAASRPPVQPAATLRAAACRAATRARYPSTGKIKLIPKCLCFIIRFDISELPFLKHSIEPIKSSNIINITGGYLYLGLNVSGFTTLNNNTTILSSLNVPGVSSFNSITLNTNYNDPSGNSLNFIIIHLVRLLLITVIHHILV
jgi:hypothetical protein